MNKALQGAYAKGWFARHNNEPRHACPYADTRKPNGSLTWSRAFIRAWRHGWDAADEKLQSCTPPAPAIPSTDTPNPGESDEQA